MALVMLVPWLLQAAVGLVLLRRGRRGALVVGHVGLSLVGLALWVGFAVAGQEALGWSAFGLLTVGNVLGDTMLVQRSRRALGTGASGRADYLAAIRSVFAGLFPRPVTFHALFAGVVYFGSLAACLVA